jgi:hypothetical protein
MVEICIELEHHAEFGHIAQTRYWLVIKLRRIVSSA